MLRSLRLSLLALGLLSIGCPETSNPPTDDDDGTPVLDDDDTGTDDDDTGTDDDDTGTDDDDATQVARPFLALDGGGAVLESEGHRLELFVAPQSPVGAAAGASHRLDLGPAAQRRGP